MKKRMLALLLALSLLPCTLPAALAAPAATASVEEAAQVLAALDVMTGDENGNLHLERTVTRAEFTKLTLAASSYRSGVGSQASVAPYPDVPRDLWYAPWVQAARDQGLVRGNLAGYFEPERTITLAEGVTMVLRLLGYRDGDFSGAWPSGQMALCRTLALDAGIAAGQFDPMSRRDALYLFYNLLTAKMKDGRTVYLTSLGHSLTADGKIDRVALLNSAMEGPIVLEGQALSSLPFDPAAAKVYRNGGESALAALKELDVVYYSKAMHTLWAWSDKVTGAIQSVAPSPASPSAVVIGGKSYPLSGPDAVYALSDLGSFRVGDTVTLLLGRSGECVAVRVPSQSSGALVGVVTSVGSALYQDPTGGSYSAKTLFLTATDGESYSFPWENTSPKFSPGDLVQAVPSPEGFRLLRPASSPVSGKVSPSGDALGEHPFAADVEILDTWSKSAIRVYPQRLSGVNLAQEDVRLCSFNENGEISRLILSDVTGDLCSYGVLTGVSELFLGGRTSTTYLYDLGGVPGAYTSQSLTWNLTEGPCQVRSEGGEVSRIYSLSGVPLSLTDGETAHSSLGRFPVSENLVVYELRDKTYSLSSLERVNRGGFLLTGYYDALPGQGGCIRVIVAQSKES